VNLVKNGAGVGPGGVLGVVEFAEVNKGGFLTRRAASGHADIFDHTTAAAFLAVFLASMGTPKHDGQRYV
jgi:hypothetical protein